MLGFVWLLKRADVEKEGEENKCCSSHVIEERKELGGWRVKLGA